MKICPVGVKNSLYSACVCSVMVHRSETWLVKEEDIIRIERSDAGINRWISNVRSEDKIFAEELRPRLKFNSLNECFQDGRLQWFRHQ